MPLDLNAIRAALAAQLRAEVAGLDVLERIPERITPPVAVIGLGAGTYDPTFEHTATLELAILILLGRQDADEAQRRLDDFLTATGPRSIRAAVDTDPTLAGTVDSAAVTGWQPPSTVELGGTDYVAVELTVEVEA